jgi:hypothetical protein
MPGSLAFPNLFSPTLKLGGELRFVGAVTKVLAPVSNNITIYRSI